jgi:Rrf2 family transcriptional regulator, cysteine metabolism repressor
MEKAMLISQKCQYALRGVFELAKRDGQGPVRIADIADAQAIPVRFLEVILAQLKQAGFVHSHRGNRGGYTLGRPAQAITVGDIIRFVEGPLGPVNCAAGGSESDCPLYGNCVFLPMWDRVNHAIAEVYDSTTLLDLVHQEAMKGERYAPSYAI